MAGLVSVVIPAFNHEAFVEACLDSALASAYPEKEIVIIDDGSTDRTAERIRAWIERHGAEISVTFRSRPNKGVSATLNEGASLAKGRYLALLASDDMLLPEGIARRVAYLEEHPRLGAVIGDCHVIDKNGALINPSSFRSFHKTNVKRYATPFGVTMSIILRWAVAGPVLMIRRDFYWAIGGYDETRVIEDYDFYLRMAARRALAFIDEPIAAYRVHGANSCLGAEKQGFILKELSASALKRAKDFPFPLNLLVFAKGIFYSLRRRMLKIDRNPAT